MSSTPNDPFFFCTTARIHKDFVGLHGFDSEDDLLDEIKRQFEIFMTDREEDEPIAKEYWVQGPCKLSAFTEPVGKVKWKSVSCLGGEKLTYLGVRMGEREGLLIQWSSDSIAGLGKATIETVVRKKPMLSQAYTGEGGDSIGVELEEFFKDINMLEEAKKRKVESVKKEKEARVKVIKKQKEHYGGGFGSWG